MSVNQRKKSTHQDIFAALSLLREHQIHCLPVLDIHKQIMGIVTPETIRAIVQPANLLKWRTVADVMITYLLHAPETQSVESLIQCSIIYSQGKNVIVNASPLIHECADSDNSQ